VDNIDQLSAAANGSGAAAGYPPMYYFPAAVLYEVSSGPLLHRIEVMRLWSIALGVVAAWLTLLIGRRLFRGHEAAAIALAVACLVQPELSQQTAVVNNDALVIAAGAACLLAALDLTRPSGRRSRWLCGLAGAALGMAMFKSFGVVFAPVLLLAWLIGRARTPKPERIRLWREVGQTVAGIGVTLGAWMAYAAAFGFHGASLADINPSPGPKDLRTYLHVLRRHWFHQLRVNWIDQLWGDFSYVNTPFPTWVQGTILVITLLTIALVIAWAAKTGLAFLRARRRTAAGVRDEPGVDHTANMVVCIAAIAATFAFFLIAGYLNYHRTGRNDLIQGRYALMLLPAIVALPALALRTLRPRISALVPTLVAAGALVMLNIGGVALVVERFYL
jgi:4-amino-4-deoxy-L-arabinose transferase-like glycosyltransferase